MNHTYRLVWNAVRQLWQCASENTRAKGKTGAVKAAANSQITPPPNKIVLTNATALSAYFQFPLTLITTAILLAIANPIFAAEGDYANGINGNDSDISIHNESNTIGTEGVTDNAIFLTQRENGIINIEAVNNNIIAGKSLGIWMTKPGEISVLSKQGSNFILAKSDTRVGGDGPGTIRVDRGTLKIAAPNGWNYFSSQYLSTYNVSVAVDAERGGKIQIDGQGNRFNSEINGGALRSVIGTEANSNIDINASLFDNIFVLAPYGQGYAHTSQFVYAVDSKVAITATKGRNIFKLNTSPIFQTPINTELANIYGISSMQYSHITIQGQENIFDFTLGNTSSNNRYYDFAGLAAAGEELIPFEGNSRLSIIALNGNNEILAKDMVMHYGRGIQASGNGQLSLQAENGYNRIIVHNLDKTTTRNAADTSSYLRGIYTFDNSKTDLIAKGNYIEVGRINAYTLTANTNKTLLSVGVYSRDSSKTNIEATQENNQIVVMQDDTEKPNYTVEAKPELRGIFVANTGAVSLVAKQGYNQITINPQQASPDYLVTTIGGIHVVDVTSEVTLQAKGNLIYINDNHQSKDTDSYAIVSGGQVILSATENNELLGADRGIYSTRNSTVKLAAEQGNNLIEATQYGISTYTGGATVLTALSGINQIAINRQQAKAEDLTIPIYGLITQDEKSSLTLTGANNRIVINDNNNSTSVDSTAFYADRNGESLLQATIGNNELLGADRGILAGAAGKTTLTAEQGYNIIDATMLGIDVRADSEAVVNGGLKLSAPLATYSAGMVQLNYAKESQISGDLLANGGQILVKSKGSTLTMKGDTVAINQGVADIALTPNSQLIGRIDNANVQSEAHHTLFPLNSYAPAKPTPITIDTAGRTVLTLAKDSLWQMTGQSWVSELRGEGTVDVSPTSAGASAGQALHIDKLAGANQFLMTLNKTGQGSDMLYIKEGTSTLQDVVIKNERDVIESMNYGDRLRFATVQQSQNEFVAGKQYTDEHRLMKQALTVEYSDQATDP
ncbi:ESPR-type extended signal peptide-containing protein, partial [Gallibacterium salpingitidis]|uniref:ESPR-type extended signal peptide-containing protein n=2 Tax=Gallibacterium salpingitidis TaxID=505341 RepID=UPI00082677D3